MSSIAPDRKKLSEKEQFEEHLTFLRRISIRYEETLTGDQDSLKRFIFCATEKLSKSCATLVRLYPAIYEDFDVEFSMGVILRSLLIDSILTQYLRYFTLTLHESGDNLVVIKGQLENESLKLIADGTMSILEDFLTGGNLPAEEQKRLAHNIVSKFPGLFITDIKTGMPKLQDEHRVSIKKMHKKGQHVNQHTKKHVYELYAFYSKYDHISHWTSIVGNIPLDERLRRLHLSILSIIFNFRDLLVLGQWLQTGSTEAPVLLAELDDNMRKMTS
jgi:hypothetical protein